MSERLIRVLRIPSLVLAAALQVLPLVRVALPTIETSSQILPVVFRWAAGALAALGGIQAVSGASTRITSPLSVDIVQGQPFALRLTTAPDQAHYWTASGLPSGLSLSGSSGQTLWQIVGTPTVTGAFNVGLTAKDQANSGASRTVAATLALRIAPGIGPPVILSPPLSRTAISGQSASFTVVASSSAPLSYQWRFEGAPLSGQTASTLAINPVGTNHAGNYDVIAGNSAGSVTSSIARLTVIVPPTVMSPPISQTVTQGQAARFSVTAAGTLPLIFQWRFQGINLAGNTGSTLVINPVSATNAGAYDVVVNNSAGTAISSAATLTVIVPGSALQILKQPVSQAVVQGQQANFSVEAGGNPPLSYQWRYGGISLSGQTNSSLVIDPATTNHAGDYDIIVSNSSGSITSVLANLTVLVPPAILASPVSLAVTRGQAATFHVVAVGTAPLNYYWRKGTTVLPGPAGPSLAIANAQQSDAASYSVIVSNGAGTAVSAPAALEVLAPPQPRLNRAQTYGGIFFNQTNPSLFCAGSFAARITASGAYSGSILLLNNRYPVSGRLDSLGRATKIVARESLNRLVITFELAGTDWEQLNGSISDGVRTAALAAHKAAWDARSNPAPQAGAYTIVLPGDTSDTRSPSGNGFGTVRVSGAGRVRYAGVLADGRLLTQGANVSGVGTWPFYRPLYAGQGAVFGWLLFEGRPEDDLHGVLNWTKLQQPLDKVYPLGFSVQMEAVGSAYNRPERGGPVLDLAGGHIRLEGGALQESLIRTVTAGGNNRINEQGLAMLIEPATGRFRGKAINPQSNRFIPFGGIVMQKQNAGYGFFMIKNRSGSAYVGP